MTRGFVRGNVQTQPAVFFELDNVVRRIRRDVAAEYQDRDGQVPPAPMGLEEQELIWPVVRYIKEKCAQLGAIPIGLDQAPYVERGLMSSDTYKGILAETILMLRDAGVDAKILYCWHESQAIPTYGKGGEVVDVQYAPRCDCRFPNTMLFKRACKVHGVTHLDDPTHRTVNLPKYMGGKEVTTTGEFRVLPPSVFIWRDDAAREAATMGVGLNNLHVDNILRGVQDLKDKTTNAHLKAAAVVKAHQKRNVRESFGAKTVENMEELQGVFESLPADLNKSVGTPD